MSESKQEASREDRCPTCRTKLGWLDTGTEKLERIQSAIGVCENRTTLKLLNRAWWKEYFSLCGHQNLTWPRGRSGQSYQRCLDCGTAVKPKVQL